MNNLARFAPFRDVLRLQDEMNRLFDYPVRALERETLSAGWVPPVDIFEDVEGITLRVEVPGLTAEDIDVRIENGTLTLKGERKLEREDQKDKYTRIERVYGAFARSFSLPPTIDSEKVRAEAKNGLLTVFLPKREETKPKQIRVKVEA